MTSYARYELHEVARAIAGLDFLDAMEFAGEVLSMVEAELPPETTPVLATNLAYWARERMKKDERQP